jgi:hypothetical protein
MRNSRSIVSASKLLVIAAVVAGLGGAAWAKKRVVVAPFTGRATEALHDDVEEVVQEDSTVISQGAFKRSQKKLRAAKLTDANVARIAADLQVDAVIEGALQNKRGRMSLVLDIRDGKTGALADSVTVPLRTTHLDADGKASLQSKLLPALAKVGALASDEPVEITPPVKQDEVDTETPLTGKKPEAPPPAETTTTVTEESDVAKDVELPTHRFARHSALDVEVGMTAALRNLRFTYRPDLAANMRPNGYKGSLVPSLRIAGEIYPLAFGGKGGAADGIGVTFDFDRVLLLKSKLGTMEFNTSQMQYGAGLVYRWPFGHKATLPTLKIIAGYSHLDFKIDHGTTPIDLPDVGYNWLDFGASIRVPLGTPNAALYLDGRYLMVLSAGEITSKTAYGSGGILGVDGDLGIELLFAKRAIVRVGGRYQRLAYDFDGKGDNLSTNRDGDSSTQDVGGALDQFFAVYATGGYLF